jgi:hypothetical protein
MSYTTVYDHRLGSRPERRLRNRMTDIAPSEK